MQPGRGVDQADSPGRCLGASHGPGFSDSKDYLHGETNRAFMQHLETLSRVQSQSFLPSALVRADMHDSNMRVSL